MLPRLNIECKDDSIKRVWPEGEKRETHGESYCYSGLFVRSPGGEKGDIRQKANLTRVTSLFADIDFVDVVALHPDCQGLSAADRKAKLYDLIGPASGDSCVDDLLLFAARAAVSALAASNLPAPTLVVSSGWGLHLHWALAPGEGEALAERVKAKDKSLDRISELLRGRFSPLFAASMLEQVQADDFSPEVMDVFGNERLMTAWGAAGVVDAQAKDIGTRLVRFPGRKNTKCPGVPREVKVLHATGSTCKFVDFYNAKKVAPEVATAVGRLQARQAADKKSFLQQVTEPARWPRTPILFTLKRVMGGSFAGMTLRAIGDQELPYTPGEVVDPEEPEKRVKVASPWRPNPEEGSDGSAFLIRKDDGYLAICCTITKQWFDDSMSPDFDIVEEDGQDSPWGNYPGGANGDLERDYEKLVKGMAVPFATVPNVLAILTKDSRYDTLVYDTFSAEFRMEYPDPDSGEVFSRPISHEHLLGDLEIYARQAYSRFDLSTNHAQGICKRALKMFARLGADEETGRQYRQDWLANYVKSFKGSWDSVPRLDEWLVRTTGCEDTPLNRLYGRKWMLQLIATGLGIGPAHAILLLRGKQGGGKSSFGQILRWGKRRMLLNTEEKAQPSAYTDRLADPTGAARDMLSSLRTAWIVEDAEALVLGHKHTGAVKALLTMDSIKARAMYEMSEIEVKLRCCLYASGNEDIELSDMTGSRRVFGVDVADRMDLDYLRENRDALFGEAVTYLLSDEAQVDLLQGRTPWVIQPDETMEVNGVQVGVLAAQSEANSKLSEENLWLNAATCAFRMNAGGKENAFTLSEFLLAADESLTTSKLNDSIRKRAAAALRSAGFKDFRPTGASVKAWRAPENHDQWVGVKQHGTGLSMLGSYDIRRKALTATMTVAK